MAAMDDTGAQPQIIRVTQKAVDAARARVDAYRRLGIEPEPTVVSLAEARPAQRSTERTA